MKPHRLSFSKTDMPCNYWARGDVECPDRPVGIQARLGSAVHLLAEHWYRGTAVPELAEDVRADAHRIFDQLAKWLIPRRERILSVEMGLRYDAENDNARLGPRRGEPGYEDVGEMVLPGTLDLCMRGEDGVLEVVDIKTGQAANAHAEQLRVQALSVSRLYDEEQVRVAFIFPRKTKCDEPTFDVLDADRLDREAGRVRKLLRTLPTAQAESGDWCFRCSLKGTCPAWAQKEA